MGPAIYSFIFAAVMAGNAVTTSNLVLSVIDWLAVVWLFYAGVVQTLHFYRSKNIIEVNWYGDEQ